MVNEYYYLNVNKKNYCLKFDSLKQLYNTKLKKKVSLTLKLTKNKFKTEIYIYSYVEFLLMYKICIP